LSRPSSRRPVAHPAAARRYAVRSGHAGTRPAAPVHGCGPKSPDSHRVVWGLISRLPVSRPGFPPVSRLPTRALSLRPPSSGFPSLGVLRFRPFGRRFPVRFPSDSLRVPFPLSNLHVSAAARRLCGHWSRAAGTKVTSSRRDPGLRSCRSARNAPPPGRPSRSAGCCASRCCATWRPGWQPSEPALSTSAPHPNLTQRSALAIGCAYVSRTRRRAARRRRQCR